MYWTNFRQATAHVQQNIFGKTLIEVCSLHLYASFGTFCVKIGQIFAAQRVFKQSEELRNRRHFPSMTAICRFPNMLQRLTVPRIIDQLGRKMCQKKRKDMDYMYINGQLSKIRSVHTYVILRTVYFVWICIYKLIPLFLKAKSFFVIAWRHLTFFDVVRFKIMRIT